MTVQQAKQVCLIPPNVSVRGNAGRSFAMKQCKWLLVHYRKIGDDLKSARLSEAKEVFKKHFSRYSKCWCGRTIKRESVTCKMHEWDHKHGFRPNKINERSA